MKASSCEQEASSIRPYATIYAGGSLGDKEVSSLCKDLEFKAVDICLSTLSIRKQAL